MLATAFFAFFCLFLMEFPNKKFLGSLDSSVRNFASLLQKSAKKWFPKLTTLNLIFQYPHSAVPFFKKFGREYYKKKFPCFRTFEILIVWLLLRWKINRFRVTTTIEWMVWKVTIGINGMAIVWQSMGLMVCQWFSKVADYRSNVGMVTSIHRGSCFCYKPSLYFK